ncbi:FecCD family ABC transporter permease [Frigidibacter sp. MR17.14]|uniref:FecCD family ABC transporter permease n=1 Tax=Frigidibacter sp. MR17.14 TaxID=3126509 RepID=UPI003FA554A3
MLGALLVAAALLSVTFGARAVGWGDILGALGGHEDTIAEAAVTSRLPRTLLACLAGAALALAGTAMQGVTRNPLADPGLLGVNAGAALAVVLGLAFAGIATPGAYIACAVAGAAIATVATCAIAGIRGRATPLRLALAGTAVTAALSSLTTAVILPRGDIGGLVQSWMIGGVGGATLPQILPVLPALGLGALLVAATTPQLNLLALGEDAAAALGSRVALARATAMGGAVLLCGATTAACGPIGFVGLVVPHACRKIFGPDHRWLVPATALCGAALLTLADTAGRLAARPGELDVGILTAFLGAPVFLWLVRRGKAGTA